jgi:dihydroorotate dehydrogenase
MSFPPVLLNPLRRVALMRLKAAAALSPDRVPDARSVRAMGMELSSPVGMAAGLDRYGTLAHSAHRLGLGFVETGTVTPLPEPGANRGIDALLVNLERNGWARRDVRAQRVRLGISIGRNAATPLGDAWRDYGKCLERGWPYADYFTLNLGAAFATFAADPGRLAALLAIVRFEQLRLAGETGTRLPIAVKLQLRIEAPEESQRVAGCVVAAGFEGMVAVSTAKESSQGHLLELLRRIARIADKRTAIISVGEIRSPQDALARFEAGASLVQIHRDLLWRPTLARAIGEHCVSNIVSGTGAANSIQSTR